MTPNYDRLATLLSETALRSDDVTLGFQDISRILGFPLPDSAFRYRQWWANQHDTSGRPQARAWSTAGFRVEQVNLDRTDGWVRFSRVGGLPSGRLPTPPPAGPQRGPSYGRPPRNNELAGAPGDSSIEIHSKVAAFHRALGKDPHHRYRSWEHCYSFFEKTTRAGIAAQRDIAALHLGFYLASWGMYRGSSFLLQRTYTVHLGVVDCLAAPRFARLWEKDVGAEEDDSALVPLILSAVDGVRDAYASFGSPTDTLTTKVLLGTLGCLPACDRFFVAGFRQSGLRYSRLNIRFVERLLRFVRAHVAELQSEQARIESTSGVRYPLMKLVGMYFWQIGYEAEAQAAHSPGG